MAAVVRPVPRGAMYQWGWAVAILENAQRGATWGNLRRNLFDGGDGEFTGAESGTFGTGRVLAVVAGNLAAYAALACAAGRVSARGGRRRVFVVSSFFLVAGARVCARVRPVPVRSRSRSRDRLDSRLSPLGGRCYFLVRADGGSSRGPRDFAQGGGAEAGDDAYGGCASSSEKTGGGALPRRKRAAAIRAEDLVKTFDGGRVAAVDGLRFVAREGEVTALLGHNGAGKTTLVSILTARSRRIRGACSSDPIFRIRRIVRLPRGAPRRRPPPSACAPSSTCSGRR